MWWGGRLFEAGRLLPFSAFRMGANSRLGAYSNKYSMFAEFAFKIKVSIILKMIQSVNGAKLTGLCATIPQVFI